MPLAKTLGELRRSGYRPRPVKEEMRSNLIARLRSGEPLLKLPVACRAFQAAYPLLLS